MRPTSARVRCARCSRRCTARRGGTGPCSTPRRTAWSSSRDAWCLSGGIFDALGKQARLSELSDLVSEPDLWDDQERAQRLLKERTDLETALARIDAPKHLLEEARLYIELGEADADESVTGELQAAIGKASAQLDALEFQRMLGGEFDGSDAILTINAGAGGTESQDWADMLFRMYTRYCDKQGWKVSLLDRQEADEAGIKSASIAVSGDYAYGMLKAEGGVHRLVRISPYDASARRHTSFAACFVYPDIEDEIEVEIEDKDLRVDTYRASGAGGQHVNKTDSAVRITHIPTGIVVQSQSQRSQHQNRAAAMKVLKARLYEVERAARTEQKDAMEAAKQEIAFGSQIRNYVLHPYRMVKDVRTGQETSNVDAVLDGDLDAFVKAFLIANPAA